MAEIATPHQTRPNRVLITEPITMANRGQIARWLEDQGIFVGVPAFVDEDEAALTVMIPVGRNEDHLGDAHLGDRIVVAGREVLVADHAHYKLWYEPIEEGT